MLQKRDQSSTQPSYRGEGEPKVSGKRKWMEELKQLKQEVNYLRKAAESSEIDSTQRVPADVFSEQRSNLSPE